MDQDVIDLSKAFIQTESGGNFKAKGASGEYGVAQWMPQTWEKEAKQVLGYVPKFGTDEMTPELQKAVLYATKLQDKQAGLNPAQIAAKHNSGSPDGWENKVGTNKFGVHYDVPKYVKSVTDAYHSIKNGGQVGADPNNPSSTASPQIPQVSQETQNNIPFPSDPNDSGLQAGLKALGNTPKSAYNFAKGVISSLNPINIVKNIADIGQGFSEYSKEVGGIGNAVGGVLKRILPETVNTLVPEGVREGGMALGNYAVGNTQGADQHLEKASKAFTEDPFGQTAPVVLALEGATKLADNIASKRAIADYVENPYTQKTIPKPTTKYSDAFGKTIETIAKPITKPVSGVLSKAKNVASAIGNSLASHLTGLEPDTIQRILSDPKSFKRLEQDNISRGGLAGEVKTAINERLKDLSETGKGYDYFRKSNQTAQVRKGIIDEVLAEKGLKVKKGKILADSNSITRSSADIKAVQKFYNDWAGKKTLNPNEYLNMRSDLADLSRFDKLTGSGKTKASADIGRSLYDRFNKEVRDTSFQELKALDDTYAPEVSFLKQVKKDYFNSDGTFKDNAPSRIANASNKVELLKRLENVIPGITKRIEILKAVEDIQKASGLKVATYSRALTGGIGFASGGIPGFIISEILTSPQAAVPILRQAGLLGQKALPIIRMLRTVAGDVPTKALKAGAFNQGVLRQ